MRILVLGSGGVGGYFGAQLARAGHEVLFVARGAHLAALRAHGLRVESPLAPVELAAVHASDDPCAMPSPDVVLFCPKLWDVKAAAAQLAPAIGPQTLVLPFQNGVEAHEWLAETLGEGSIAIGVAQIATAVSAPGVITHSGTFARMKVGLLPGTAAPERVGEFANAAAAAGIEIAHVPDALRTLWEKFVFLVAMSGLTSVARKPIGAVRADPDLRAMLEASMRETVALARTHGVVFGDDFVHAQMGFVDGLHAEMRSSMLHDLLAGRRLEAPWLCGSVARRARERRMPAPVNRLLYAALQPFENGVAGG